MSGNDLSLEPITIHNRALGLDALRGFAIITMIFSWLVPHGYFPAWMYHAQNPPPTHQFSPIPGITWVDLVLPFFIFSIGAAIPLALSKRIDKGASQGKVLFHIAKRTLLFVFFAIFYRHIQPHILQPDWAARTPTTWLISLLGFITMFALFMRPPKSWSKKLSSTVKIAGWLSAILLLIFLRFPDGTGFSVRRINIVVVQLLNAFFFSALVWFVTKNNILLRLGSLAILLALRYPEPTGWVLWLRTASAIPWVYRLSNVWYLFVAIPGTIVGDLLVEWTKNQSTASNNPAQEIAVSNHWSQKKLMGIIVLMLAFILTILIGLQARWLWQTTIISFGLCALGWHLFSKPSIKIEYLFQKLFSWGAFWLILGLVFEPFEGGIKKDRTLSYFFITAALAIFLLIVFMIIIDVFKKQGWLRLLIDSGQNPMMAFTVHATAITPIFALVGLGRLIRTITPTPELGLLRGFFYALLTALFACFFTRRKIFWRV